VGVRRSEVRQVAVVEAWGKASAHIGFGPQARGAPRAQGTRSGRVGGREGGRETFWRRPDSGYVYAQEAAIEIVRRADKGGAG
jgi:hypothetical protein